MVIYPKKQIGSLPIAQKMTFSNTNWTEDNSRLINQLRHFND